MNVNLEELLDIYENIILKKIRCLYCMIYAIN